MLDNISPAICLDFLQIAAQNQSADILLIAEEYQTAPCRLFDLLMELMAAGVLICGATDEPNQLRLRFGPKAVQAVYLFALNDDMPCEAA